MKRRCYDTKNIGYRWWGGRGISVCAEWRESFDAFLRDMGERPKGCTLERIDNDGNYEPGNCRWATHKEQQRHRANNRPVTAFGRTQLLVEWAEEFGVSPERIAYRLSVGVPAERAVSAQPLDTHSPLDNTLQSSIDSLRAAGWGRDDIMRLYGLTKHFWRRYSGQITY